MFPCHPLQTKWWADCQYIFLFYWRNLRWWNQTRNTSCISMRVSDQVDRNKWLLVVIEIKVNVCLMQQIMSEKMWDQGHSQTCYWVCKIRKFPQCLLIFFPFILSSIFFIFCLIWSSWLHFCVRLRLHHEFFSYIFWILLSTKTTQNENALTESAGMFDILF